MKLRHVIPHIPIIGFFYIFYIAGYLLSTKYYNDINSEYVWGSDSNFFLSIVTQTLSIFAITVYFIFKV